MDLPRIASWAAGMPWLLREEKLHAIALALTLRLDGGGGLTAPDRISRAKALRRSAAAFTVDAAGGRVAYKEGEKAQATSITVLPIYGTICPRMHQMEDGSGGVSCERIGRWLGQAANDSKVAGIVLDIDSPGGSVYGVGELADQVRAVAEKKPVLAVANHEACSAAYWLAAAASEVGVTTNGIVGSVGCYTMHQCFAKAMEQEGVETTVISAGKFKVLGNPFEPLSETAKGKLQDMVNGTMEQFTAALARFRGKSVEHVRKQFGQGWIVTPDDAKAAGMVGHVGPFDTLMSDFAGRVLGRMSGAKVAAAAAARDRDLMLAQARLKAV